MNTELKRRLNNIAVRQNEIITRRNLDMKELWALRQKVEDKQWARYWTRQRLAALEKRMTEAEARLGIFEDDGKEPEGM